MNTLSAARQYGTYTRSSSDARGGQNHTGIDGKCGSFPRDQCATWRVQRRCMMVQSASKLSADEKRQRMVIGTMPRNGYTPDALIETLHTAQSAFGYLDDT